MPTLLRQVRKLRVSVAMPQALSHVNNKLNNYKSGASTSESYSSTSYMLISIYHVAIDFCWASNTVWLCVGYSENTQKEMSFHMAVEGLRPSIADFPEGFNLSTNDIWGQIVLYRGRLSCDCWMLSSILDFYPSVRANPSLWQRTCLQIWPDVSWGQTPLVRKYFASLWPWGIRDHLWIVCY